MIQNKLSKKIDAYQSKIVDEPRDYIGASSIGSDCLRQIWYEFKGTKSEGVIPKTRRTWDIGKALESRVLKWLDDAGIKVETNWADLQSKECPVFKGHIDAIWKKSDGSDCIIEVKTAKDASFKVFVKNGLKSWQPKYYAQVQAYMGMSGVHSSIVIVLNKDNSELCDEEVVFDIDFYKMLEQKALWISQQEWEPQRINESPMWFQCKMCKYHSICHK